jgi:hypothetical protein
MQQANIRSNFPLQPLLRQTRPHTALPPTLRCCVCCPPTPRSLTAADPTECLPPFLPTEHRTGAPASLPPGRAMPSLEDIDGGGSRRAPASLPPRRASNRSTHLPSIPPNAALPWGHRRRQIPPSARLPAHVVVRASPLPRGGARTPPATLRPDGRADSSSLPQLGAKRGWVAPADCGGCLRGERRCNFAFPLSSKGNLPSLPFSSSVEGLPVSAQYPARGNNAFDYSLLDSTLES